MNKGRVIIISGPSGVGKDTVLVEVFKKCPELRFSRSCITRPMRNYETADGKYRFIDREQFLKMLDNGEFLEYNEFADNLYGTPKQPIIDAVENGFDIVIECDVNGADKLKALLPECLRIFIMPPSVEELKKRLIGRKSDSLEKINERLEIAVEEMKHAPEYDYVVVNDEICKAADRFIEIINNKQ